MHQHSSFVGQWSALLLCILGSTTAAAADANLDERLSVPRVADQESLRARAADYRVAFEQKARSDSVPGAFIRDAATYHKRGDMLWSIEQALDEKRALDLTQLGFSRTGTDTYTIRSREAPQWISFDTFLEVLSRPDGEGHLLALKQRGFREQDIDVLRSYLGNHRPERISVLQNERLTEKFAASVAERRRRGTFIPPEEVQAYRYHATRNVNEARRQWAVGLLDALDKQRQRILMSYFEELDIVYSLAVSNVSQADIEAETSKTLDYLASGRYRQDFARQKADLQREMPQ